jgi:DNA polymerase-3 subunit alpha
MHPPFVHLKVHTEFSLVDGIVKIKPLTRAVVDAGMPAVAIADDSNFFGLVKFYQACVGSGIKPIFACDLQIHQAGEEELPFTVTAVAQNLVGYGNLRKLLSRAWLEGQSQGKAFVQREWLCTCGDGLIILSGGKFGDIGRALLNERPEQAMGLAQWWQARFADRFYVEVQRTGRADDETYVFAAVELATRLNLPVVATNDVRFLETAQYEAHEVRVCIAEGRALDDPRRQRRYSAEQYLKNGSEMVELFADIPEAIANTVEIARRCTVPIELGKYYLPEYPVPEGMTMDTFFREVSHAGLEKRLEKVLKGVAAEESATQAQVYRDRLDFELDTIISMGFPGYFLIVMDFIRWAKDNGIPVGPGRGSGAGSLVAYALLITDLDPLAYDLLFERFLNPERVSMPDFDIDFCMEGRDRVINYVADRYGRDSVSQIITFGTLAAKAAVRDVARAQGKPYGLADKLSKMIPFEPGITMENAYAQEEVLRDHLATDEQAQEVWEMARQLEGVARNVGKHAGGVVIAPTALTDFAPLHSAGGEGIVTQYDKNDVEEVGLVKFDFLGLRTLTIIDWAVKMINQRRLKQGEQPLDITSIPLDDAATFKMLQDGQTTAVFQLESRGMKDLIRRLRPNTFEDIIALVALFRPGPLQSGMVDDFINRKHGRAEVAYPHPKYQHECLQHILEPTYGIILYQEQVMQIAQAMGGFSLGSADLLRRAMGKKKPEEMAKQRELFLTGATGLNFDSDLANNIFDLMEKFAGYGFNKSHSAAYALVSYQTAWLKTHYPAEFMAATMSSDMDKTDKVVTFIEEARVMKLEVKPPDVNRGEFQFSVDDSGHIIYGLGAIKGLGEGPVAELTAARQGNVPFADLFDFCARVDARKLNKRALEALIKSGAFDCLKAERALLQAALPDAVKAAEQLAHNSNSGIDDMFGTVDTTGAVDNYADYASVAPWSPRDRLKGEKAVLGLYVSGHPIEEYLQELGQFTKCRIADLRPDKTAQAIAGLVVSHRIMKTKRGDDLAILVLDDRSGRIEATLFAEALALFRDKLVDDIIVVCEGPVSLDERDGSLKMRANMISTLADARSERATAVVLRLDSVDFRAGFAQRLMESLGADAGKGCPLWIEYSGAGARGRIALGNQWCIDPSEDCLGRLIDQFGADRVNVLYQSPGQVSATRPKFAMVADR